MGNVVIGAGSVGILTSKLLATRSNNSVTLLESSTVVGGVTRDIEDDENQRFFSGCHYLDLEYSELAKTPRSPLVQFDQRYASLTQIGPNWFFKEDFAGPVFPTDFFRPNTNIRSKFTTEEKSLKDRLSNYPNPISDWLYQFSSRVASPEVLPPSSAKTLGISRVSSFEEEDELRSLKLESDYADSLYGLPRSSLGIAPKPAFMPQHGYTHLWESLVRDLQEEGNFQLKRMKVNQKSAFDSVSKLGTGAKIWTADPRFLVRHCLGTRLDSLAHRKHVFGLSLKSEKASQPSQVTPYYINVYSHHSPITRLFVYTLENQLRLSVEAIEGFSNEVEMRRHINSLLSKTSCIEQVEQKGEVMASVANTYHPMSNRDLALLKAVQESLRRMEWTYSGLDEYDRASKMAVIMRQLD